LSHARQQIATQEYGVWRVAQNPFEQAFVTVRASVQIGREKAKWHELQT